MGDMGDDFRAVRDAKRAIRDRYGVPCPECVVKLPRASPSILLPQQVCKIHRYRDPRKRGPEHTIWEQPTDGGATTAKNPDGGA
jgi:hypothetical protein